MDTGKQNKQLFWILSGAAVGVLLIAWVVGWWMISSEAQAQADARDGVFTNVNGLDATIPNDDVSNELESRKQELTTKVYDIWQQRYDRQLEHFKEILTDDSQDAIAILTGEQEVTVTIRDRYRDLLGGELKKLHEHISLRTRIEDPEQPAGTQNNGGRGGRGTGARGGPGNPGGTSGPGGGPGGISGTGLGAGTGQAGAAQDDGSAAGGQNIGGSGDGANATGQFGELDNSPGYVLAERPKQEFEGIVAWDDHELVLDNYFAWNTEGRTPTPDQLKYAIEYWAVMHSLLDVVRLTNDGAQDHFEAPIKQIRKLRISRFGPTVDGAPVSEVDAPATDDSLAGPGGNAPGGGNAATGGPGDIAGATLGMGGGSASAEFGALNDEGGAGGGVNRARGQASAATSQINPDAGMTGFSMEDSIGEQPATKEALEAGRYVNDEGGPVMSPAANPHSEFFMIPMFMEVVIDQRKIGHYLDNLANSPLPVEVKQICTIMRILPEEKNEGGIVEYTPHDVLLRVRGVVYIYQKPDEAKLGKKPSEFATAAAAGQPGNPLDN